MEKGSTALVLGALLDGMAEAGCAVELVYASRLKIKPCSCGQMICWYKTPGECCFEDDMQALYAELRQDSILVLATPVYIPLPGRMQDLLNRLCPLVLPQLETRAGRTRARFRDDVRIEKIALVATGGWWERANMDTVVRIAEEFAEDASVAFAGAVLRPHAFAMRRQGELTVEGRAVLEAAKQAGIELVHEGRMGDNTLEAVGRPLIGEDELRAAYNAMV
jgi:multimeric flavodoxin WrbA